MQPENADRGPSRESDQIGREFDEDACDFCDRYQKRGLSRSSTLLLSFILQGGILGRSVADLGCGAGGFSIELLKKGATSSIGIDLSKKMIESATQLAHATGFDTRAKFELGNAATVDLPITDLVIMDKILCCYSEWEPLLKNAIGSSKDMIGFIVPRDEGVAKWPFRLGVRVVNFFQRRSKAILFYLHPLDRIDETLLASGFILRKRRASRFWLVFLYSRKKDLLDQVDRC